MVIGITGVVSMVDSGRGISKDKRSTIRLNDQPVTELDYGSLHTHLMYARVGVRPKGDLYEIPDVPRKVAKHAIMLMIGAKRRQQCRSKPGRIHQGRVRQ